MQSQTCHQTRTKCHRHSVSQKRQQFLDQSKLTSESWHSGSNGHACTSIAGYLPKNRRTEASQMSEMSKFQPRSLWESLLMHSPLLTVPVIKKNQLFDILVDKMVNFAVMTAGCCVVVLRFLKLRPCTEITHRDTASSTQQIMLPLGLTILPLFALFGMGDNWLTNGDSDGSFMHILRATLRLKLPKRV